MMRLELRKSARPTAQLPVLPQLPIPTIPAGQPSQPSQVCPPSRLAQWRAAGLVHAQRIPWFCLARPPTPSSSARQSHPAHSRLAAPHSCSPGVCCATRRGTNKFQQRSGHPRLVRTECHHRRHHHPSSQVGWAAGAAKPLASATAYVSRWLSQPPRAKEQDRRKKIALTKKALTRSKHSFVIVMSLFICGPCSRPHRQRRKKKKFFPDSLPLRRPFPAAAADFRDGADGHSALICRGCGEREAAGCCCGDRQASAMPGALMMTDGMVSKLHGETAWLASSRPKMSPWSSQSTGGV